MTVEYMFLRKRIIKERQAYDFGHMNLFVFCNYYIQLNKLINHNCLNRV